MGCLFGEFEKAVRSLKVGKVRATGRNCVILEAEVREQSVQKLRYGDTFVPSLFVY